MKRTVMFTRLFVKRLLKKPSFVFVLLMMPVIIFSFRWILEKDNDTLRVGIINEDDNEAVRALVDKVCTEDGVISFYRESSEAKLKNEVLNGHVDCGFVFRDGAYEALSENAGKNTITLYSSNKSSVYYYALEKIYAELYHSLAFKYMHNSLEDYGFYELENAGSKEEALEFTRKIFEYYLEDGGVFDLHILKGDEETVGHAEDMMKNTNYLMRPVKGTLAVFVMLAALSGAIYLIIDEKNGVYKTLGYRERPLVNIGVTFIPTFLGGIVAYISLLASGLSVSPVKEAGIMLLYVILIAAVVNLLRCIISNEIVLCSLLPLLVVVSILGCDVFFDLSVWSKAIKTVRLFLLPNYYLETMRSVLGAIYTLVGVVVIGTIGILVDKKRMR